MAIQTGILIRIYVKTPAPGVFQTLISTEYFEPSRCTHFVYQIQNGTVTHFVYHVLKTCHLAKNTHLTFSPATFGIHAETRIMTS